MAASTDNMIWKGRTLVIDNGSNTCRAGVAGEMIPRSVFAELVGKPKLACLITPCWPRDLYIGDEAIRKVGILRLTYPIQYGLITDWDSIQSIWQHTFNNELRYSSEESPTLLTESPSNPKEDRVRLATYFFEALHIPALYLANVAMLPLYMAGRMTGIALDSGYSLTRATAIYEGYTIRSTIHEMHLGGRDLTEYMMRLDLERGFQMRGMAEQLLLNEVKEQVAIVVPDFEWALKECAAKDPNDKNFARHRYQTVFDLPNGNCIQYDETRFRVPECLFNPKLAGKDFAETIHTLPCMSLRDCDLDIRSTMASNIILTGGSTCISGLPLRLQFDRSFLAQNDASECSCNSISSS